MIRSILANLNEWDVLLCTKISGLNGKRILDRTMRYASRLGDGYFVTVHHL